MNGDGRPRQRRQRVGGRGCDGGGPVRGHGGLGRGVQSGSDSSLGGRTTTRALVAVGAYMAQDLRDAEGLMRPMLRRAAMRLALSRRQPARRLGHAYLRLDPPEQTTLPAGGEVIDATSASPSPAALALAAGTDAQSPGGQGAPI